MKKRVGQFLIDEIAKQGVDKIFGVPGDFNLSFLDDIEAHQTIDWVGNTNELNASYAADGYARIHGLAAMVTTFGVGELSAVNGIAGSFAERVPVIQITGGPTTAVEKAGSYVHHSLGNGQFDDYQKMYAHITAAQTVLSEENALIEVPRMIKVALEEKRPVHIHLPIDIAMREIEIPDNVGDAQATEEKDLSNIVEKVTKKLHDAKQVTLIVGHEINSFALQHEVQTVAERLNLPVAQLSLGKSAFNEESTQYMGMYDGEVAETAIRDYVDGSDLVLTLGAKLTDSATAGFSQKFPDEAVMMLNHHQVKIGDYETTEPTLAELIEVLKMIDFRYNGDFPQYQWPSASQADDVLNDAPLTQENYFKLMQTFVRKGDVILAEQGTSFFGAYNLALEASTTFIGQPLWGSIGYTLPSTLGTLLAAPQRRHVLLIGDGSLQLTAQEMSTMIRQKLNPVVFIINNEGYTVEKKIHGETAEYNNIQTWDYKLLPALFGNKAIPTYDVRTTNELKATMDRIEAQPNTMHVVEVHMDVLDAPETLDAISKAFAAQNE
ncbi:alpha-keto acid decarboxylase family protein [Staphylococcus lutrae]|uniref:Alpha-keto-acid decarboxylase n=1 Tax=Staphylococcus lutrae TaxID=155085 RepID=A0AAC9WJ93_9STAP|nr:thiamine pyrophosphate-binding protein [Staphylococcus lutrae]ARJ50596.1 pyruvate decarboxylase [Staphylococcus lutrae]PNZ37524.1 pyruvate decarboxylase [Staphylococcus lutrae]